MDKALMAALVTSISEVMETMFFLPVEYTRQATLSECGLDRKKVMSCQLSFTGDFSGRIVLAAHAALVIEMTQNFMGEPQDHLTDEYFTGTLTEMLNMVCGNALNKIRSEKPFELGIPEVVDLPEALEKDRFGIIETMQSKIAVLLKLDE